MSGLTHAAIVNVMLVNERNEILLMERINTKTYAGYFAAPGGGVELGETLADAAVRELREELGVIAKVEDLVMVGCVERGVPAGYSGRSVHFFFLCTKWNGEPANLEPDKHGDPRWFSRDSLPGKAFEEFQMVLEDLGRQWIVLKE